jgi:hypothetical protein
MHRHTDEQLGYWADRYIAAGLAPDVTFDRFMSMSPERRERELIKRVAEQSADEQLPVAAELHDQRLMDRMRPAFRRFLRPWFLVDRRRQLRLRRNRVR